MEKKGYREQLEMLKEQFPDRQTITPQEVAEVLGVNVKTVYSAMKRVRDPLPSIKITKNRSVVPIARLASWMA